MLFVVVAVAVKWQQNRSEIGHFLVKYKGTLRTIGIVLATINAALCCFGAWELIYYHHVIPWSQVRALMVLPLTAAIAILFQIIHAFVIACLKLFSRGHDRRLSKAIQVSTMLFLLLITTITHFIVLLRLIAYRKLAIVVWTENFSIY